MIKKTPAEFATQLRHLADLYESEPDLPTPGFDLRITAHSEGDQTPAYLAARRVFPDATVDSSDIGFVYLDTRIGLRFAFWKNTVGEQQTVTRQVVEYVLPEPVAAELESVAVDAARDAHLELVTP